MNFLTVPREVTVYILALVDFRKPVSRNLLEALQKLSYIVAIEVQIGNRYLHLCRK